MDIPVYNLGQLTALSTEEPSIGVKRLEQGFRHKENIKSSHRHNFYQIIWVTKGLFWVSGEVRIMEYS